MAARGTIPPPLLLWKRGVVVEAGRESFIVSRDSVVDFVRGDAEMTSFDVIQSFTTLWEEILSLIVWASAVAGSGLAVLVVGKWWAGVEEHTTRK